LFVIVRTEHLSGWKAISQSLSHLAAASRSSWRLSQSFWDYDLPEYLKSSQLRLFADDSIIYKTIKSQKECDSLQEDFDAATRWERFDKKAEIQFNV
jgi:hypothetical protein